MLTSAAFSNILQFNISFIFNFWLLNVIYFWNGKSEFSAAITPVFNIMIL